MALSNKQEVWLEEYLTTWNATEAARRAGYAHPRQSGAENLSNVVMVEEIRARIAERAMSADEVLIRLGEQARGDIDDVLTTSGELDIEKARQLKKTKLIKKLSQRRTLRTKDNETYEEVSTTVEMYDAQAALVHIGRHHGLFTDKSEMLVGGKKDADAINVKFVDYRAGLDGSSETKE